jgi:hypothetical protein
MTHMKVGHAGIDSLTNVFDDHEKSRSRYTYIRTM